MTMPSDKQTSEGLGNEQLRRPTPRALEEQLEFGVLRASPRRTKAFLLVSTGQAAGMVFPVTEPTMLIGRSPDADVWINEHALSHEHARLEQTAQGFTLRDLGSTNGTYVNGQRVEKPVVLSGGDSIRMGSTSFTFVTRAAELPKGTVRLENPQLEPPVEPRRRRLRDSLRVEMAPASQYTDSLSLTQAMRRARELWAFTRRYGSLALIGVALGATGGLAHVLAYPPPSSAWFEMSVVSSERASEEENAEFFVGAESTFRSLPLIKKTLQQLGAPSVSDARATEVQSALSFERLNYRSRVFRGTYQNASAERAVAFLSQHLRDYIDSELDKVLKVLRSEANFDREQEQRAAERAAQLRERLVAFSDEHPEAVPKDAKLPDPAHQQLAPGASVERVQESIASDERALQLAYARIQSRKAQPYLESAAQTDNKIAAAHARGLRDGHPEVKSLLALKAAMAAKASAVMAAEPSAAEQALDPQIASLKEELTDLRSRLRDQSAPSAVVVSPVAGRAEPSVAVRDAAGLVAVNPSEPNLQHRGKESLAQLRIQYAELAREYERDRTEQDALTKKRETTDRELERAQTSAEARFEIITPPTASKASTWASLSKRVAAGGLLGLALAFFVAAGLELRRVLILRGQL